MKIHYLNTETSASLELGRLLAKKLQESETSIVELFPSAKATQILIVNFLTQYDIIIFDGTIENDAELNNSKYNFLEPSMLLRDNFVISNFVPQISEK